ncbi:YdgA family protein [Reinekea forsetii]|nr:YdgA family protein [Reinekea forsetii]
MKKALLISTAVVVAIGAAGAGAMYLVDGQIDNAISQLESQIPAPMTLSVVSDSSSFTDRQLVLKVGMELEGESVYVLLNNDIQKRPWGTSIEHALTLDPTLIELVDDEQAAAFLSTNFVNSPMLAGHTSVSMMGSYQSNLASFSVNETLGDVNVVFTPWTIQANGNASGNIELTSNWNGFTLVSADEYQEMNFNWQPMKIMADGKYHQGSTFVGKQTVTGGGASFVMDDGYDSANFQMGPFSMVSNGDLVSDRYKGDFRWDTESVSFNADGSVFTLNDLVFSMNMSGFEINNFTDLSQELNAMSTAGSLEPSPEVIRMANVVLQDGFSIGIPEFSAKVDGKTAKMSFMASLPQNEIADLGNPFSLMGLIPTVVAQADLLIHKDIANMPEVSEQVFSLMMMGALMEEGDNYVMSASFENGAAKLNGQPMPLPF